MARGGQRGYGNAGRTAYSGGTKGAQSRAVFRAGGGATAGVFTVNDHVIANMRMTMPYITTTTAAETGIFHWMPMRSPEWDTTCPSIGVAAFFGATGQGETALGNDLPYEALAVEINNVKYFLSTDGSNSFSTTPGPQHKITALNGAGAWTDPNIALPIPKNTWFRIGWAALVPSGAKYHTATLIVPGSLAATVTGRCDAGSAGVGSRLTALQNDTTTTGASFIPASFFNAPPVGFTSKPATPADAAIAKAVMIAGMSIDAGAFADSGTAAIDSAHFMRGEVAWAMADPSGGRIPAANFAVGGTRVRDMLNAGQPGSAANGWAMRDAFWAQRNYPWSTVVFGMPINDVNAGAALAIAGINDVAAAWKARGNRNVVMLTGRPQTQNTNTGTTTANGYLWTGGDDFQNLAGDAAHVAIDNHILSKPPNVDAVIDIRPAHETSTGSRKWKSGVATTLTSLAAGPATGFTGGLSGDTLTVETAGTGTIVVGQRVRGSWSNSFTVTVTGFGTGTGGVGTYTVSNPSGRTGASGGSITFDGTSIIQVAASTGIRPGDSFAMNPSAPARTLGEGLVIVNEVNGNSLTLKGGVAKDYASGSPVVGQWTSDGTHITSQSERAGAAIIIAAKGSAIK